MVKLLIAYVAVMAAAGGVFSFLWREWQGAPDVFYGPWALTGWVAAAMGFSFLLSAAGKKDRGEAGAGVNRYAGGAAVRGAGVLAVIFVPVWMCPQGQWDKVALVLCVMALYGVSMAFYLAWVWQAGRRKEKQDRF